MEAKGGLRPKRRGKQRILKFLDYNAFQGEFYIDLPPGLLYGPGKSWFVSRALESALLLLCSHVQTMPGGVFYRY
jgi:hypothetical protein